MLAHYPLRATILQPADPENNSGAAVDVYEELHADVPVYFETLRGREYWEAKALNAETVGRIKMRYIQGITADMRISLNDRTFEIIPPIDNMNERNKELVLTVKEVI